ncbi:hypothetical protein PpBr36_00454 [Pyricularia pennisetigena]|uniref:hypothetical protein n=1 Tax=Pyricularia pennisetigena TaxID=1578925 RepID=UPI001152E489|nr:hypothetical protein PpBr36_00454 [Pyricularia pennisetigena]TLS29772.1 hypothetical protein PpBr36_00454 [Pyricularia pennisetigena]
MAKDSAGHRARLESIFKGEDIFGDLIELEPDQGAAMDEWVSLAGVSNPTNSSRRQNISARPKNQGGTDNESDSSDGPTLRKTQMAKQQHQPRSGYRHILRTEPNIAASDLDVDDMMAEEVRRAQDTTWTGLGRGQLAPREESFTPWSLVERYPANFIGNGNRPAASPYFGTPAVYNNQIWDFYYIQNPSPGRLPVLLVPTKQLQHLLKYTNAALGINLTIPIGTNADKFKVWFGLGGTPRPRFLGRTTSLDEFLALPALASLRENNPLNGVTSQAQQQFRELIDGLSNVQAFKKGDAKKKKRAIQRVADRQKWGLTTKRVQRYLGLRQGKQQFVAQGVQYFTLSNSQARLPLDIKFVCVDVETYELNHNLVTEIGIAELDTLSLRGKPAGDKSQNWFNLIKSYHYVIKENSWAMNGQHVANNQQNFNFGQSQLVPKATIVQQVASHLGMPSSSWPGHRGAYVVLVGHDIMADVEHLLKVDYDARKVPEIFDVVDTAHMFQHWRREPNSTRLSRVLESLEIRYRYLHNAGNDATYTLQAMLAMAQVTRQESFDRAMGKRIERPLQENEVDNEGGWSSDEGNDGGDPVGLPRANGYESA